MAARKKAFTVEVEYDDELSPEPCVGLIHNILTFDGHGYARYIHWHLIQVSPND